MKYRVREILTQVSRKYLKKKSSNWLKQENKVAKFQTAPRGPFVSTFPINILRVYLEREENKILDWKLLNQFFASNFTTRIRENLSMRLKQEEQSIFPKSSKTSFISKR